MAAPSCAIGPHLAAARVAAELAAQASIEMGALDARELPDACGQLRASQRVFVSYLPGQGWEQGLRLCAQLSAAGLEPVPHIPVRLLRDAHDLDAVLGAARDAGVREPLLISGDYPSAQGPFGSVLNVLRTGALQARGFERVAFAGHPEGHPHVPWDLICEAQLEKWRVASQLGLEVTFITQFFFAAEPFVQWARLLRAAGVRAKLVAGIAGPTGLGRLIKLARHCGVGASMRALTSRPASMMRLWGDHHPDELLVQLAAEKLRHHDLFDGVHLFSLGGFLRTASWLRRLRPGPAE